jgi:PTH2 family peptidyl-tRNA hydrolase
MAAKRIKQVIVIRKDLNMRKGKLAAQAAHSSLAVFFNLLKAHPNSKAEQGHFELDIDNPFMLDWMNGHFTKIGVYVNSEQELLDLHQKAQAAGLPCALIKDAGFTEFNEPTFTSLAIGPDDPEKIDLLTGHLPLY